MRLIDADALIRKFKTASPMAIDGRARQMVEEQPTIEPEKRTAERTETHACDCIDRQAAIDALIRKIRPHNNGDGTITMWVMSEELVRETLNEVPSAQPEIIRCKECRYADEDGVCQNSKGLAIQDDYDFCSFAERRTDENNNE